MDTWPSVELSIRAAAERSNSHQSDILTIHVSGRPGGTVRIRDNAIVDVWTTGTPLVRFRGESPDLLGPAATADALFVIAAGRVWGVHDEQGAVGRAEAAVDVDTALREVRRRLARLVLPDRVIRPEEDRMRPTVRGARRPSRRLTAPEETLLRFAVGGHTLRELAFLTGRGVFPVVLDVLTLLDTGSLEFVPDLVGRPTEVETTVRLERVRAASPSTPEAFSPFAGRVAVAGTTDTGDPPVPAPPSARAPDGTLGPTQGRPRTPSATTAAPTEPAPPADTRPRRWRSWLSRLMAD